MHDKQNLWLFAVCLAAGIISLWAIGIPWRDNSEDPTTQVAVLSEDTETAKEQLTDYGMSTDTSKSTIQFSEIADGGVWKDGIPALTDPKFLQLPQDLSAVTYLQNSDEWIVLVRENTAKFYPYAILNRHEIVNDTINNQPVLVTFCPLCGTSIVYSPVINGKTLQFGVSWLLYNSNLLMYDKESESLWLQATWKAVVWESTASSLSRIPHQVITRWTFQQPYPNGLVLSDETWYDKAYTVNPYSSYLSNDQLLFPVNTTDPRLAPKELLIVAWDGYSSVVFVRSKLQELWEATVEHKWFTYTARWTNTWVTIQKWSEMIPHYYEMRFSRVANHEDTSGVWWIE